MEEQQPAEEEHLEEALGYLEVKQGEHLEEGEHLEQKGQYSERVLQTSETAGSEKPENPVLHLV